MGEDTPTTTTTTTTTTSGGGDSRGINLTRKANASTEALKRPPVVVTHAKKHAVVYPWNLVPDWAISTLTGALLLPYLPLFVVTMIMVMSWHGLMVLFNRLLGGLPYRLWERGAELTTRWGTPLTKDPRDGDKVAPTLFLLVWTPLVFSLAFYRQSTYGFEWWLVPLYHVLRLGPRYRFFAWLYVLIHQEGHAYNGWFKPPLGYVFNAWFGISQWWSAVFFGQIPGTFRVSHNKCHHRHDNMLDDVCTNLDLDRSKPWSFIYYFPRFAAYWTGFGMVAYFGSRKEWGLLKHVLLGMAMHYALWALSFYYMGVLFTMFYVIFPHFEGIIFFGGISYLWHAFCEPDDPYNSYVNSMTILEGHDNIWNEDLHVEHHNCSNLHPADYPKHYAKFEQEFARNQATIFRDCEEGTLLKMLLSEEWDEMAKKFVDLNGKMTHEEKKATILRRLRSRFNRPEDDRIQMAKEAAMSGSSSSSSSSGGGGSARSVTAPAGAANGKKKSQ